MFLETQNDNQIQRYEQLLKALAAFSGLFTDNIIPYLYYRTAENAFCLAFEADNLSRNDTSVDARKDYCGIGLKTYLNKKSAYSYEKVAEFNSTRYIYKKYLNSPEKLIKFIASCRNKRIQTSVAISGVNSVIYHSVVRSESAFKICEEQMKYINTDKIKNIKQTSDNSIAFNDGGQEYIFNISKSTLFKKFYIKPIKEIEIITFKDPFSALEDLYLNKTNQLSATKGQFKSAIFLPLYSDRNNGEVPESSGLNQWNAKGRKRDEREVYIPIPAWIHKNYPTFFPDRELPFQLKLPNGQTLTAKVCQEGGKALMSNPNNALGDWILGDVLKVKPGTLVTRSTLDEIGIDSIEIWKLDKLNFEINFKETGTYQQFKEFSKS